MIILTLAECAGHLTRIRPSLPRDAQGHASNLIQQLAGYDRNPVVLRPLILASIERLETANR